MKTAAVLLISIRLCLSLPRNGNDLERTEQLPQTDSVPIALLFLVPPQPQLRDEEDYEDADSEEFSFFDQLFQDSEIPFYDQMRQSESLFSEGLKDTKFAPWKFQNGKLIAEEPISLIEDRTLEIPFKARKVEVHVKTFLKSYPFRESETLYSNNKNDKEGDLKAKIKSIESSLNLQGDSSPTLAETSIITEGPLELSRPAYSQKLRKQISKSLLRMLNNPTDLDCTPKVEQGHLEAVPLYRDLKAIHDHHSKKVHDSGDRASNAELFGDTNTKEETLDLNSPTSIITSDRNKRNLWDTGATHYRVSEDFPETIKGNHHIVSADFPQPNMVKITSYDLRDSSK